MFFDCTSLTSLDLSNFDTSQVTEMFGMFYSCSSLTSLDLSYFDTSQVIDMGYMFSYCSSLTSLNLSNFNTSKISFIHEMFSYCNNLEYINLYNFDEILLNSFIMFDNVSINIVICLNENINEANIPQISRLSCHVKDCSNDWKSKQKKINGNTNECIENCDNINQYEYNGKCVSSCSYVYL